MSDRCTEPQTADSGARMEDSTRLFPSWPELEELRSPLTPGERALVQFLDRELPPAWRIYVQPYVNDMRPDVVVVNPLVGLVVFEVKDWQLGRYHFENGQLIGQTDIDRWVEEDPLVKTRWYAQSLYEQFLVCDEAELDTGLRPNNLSLFRHAVYFHGATTAEAHGLYRDRLWNLDIVFGCDSLVCDRLDYIVPHYSRRQSRLIRERQISALEMAHAWLVPPRGALEQQTPLPPLTSEQRGYAIPDKGFRRIRGVAGAGKSFVLAHRAAAANVRGGNILVLCFNITMSHALRDLLKRAPGDVDWKRVSWSHFHGWAITQTIHAGINLKDIENSDSQDFNERLIKGLEQIVRGDGLSRGYDQPKYSGIYIDEGQDFEPAWLDVLSAFLEEDGELVLFADHRQNLYGRDGGKDATRRLRRCKFSGPWGQLPRKSHRLPWRVAMFLNEFAASTRLGDNEDLSIQDFAERPAQDELELDVLAWQPVASMGAALDALEDARAALGNPHPNDVVVLLADHASGLEAIERLQSSFGQIVHVFSEDKQEQRRRKLAFWMGRGGLKMCTIHSFKGWEIDNVILVWPSEDELQKMPEEQRQSLFYTGISRGLRNMVVLNANRSYDAYFSDWDLLPEHEVAA